MAWSEDVVARFEAYGWHATRVEDGNDIEAIAAAIEEARADDRPSLIAVRTHIGFGSPNRQDTQKAHGQPLGADEVRLVKEAYGWDPDRSFFVPPTRRSSCSGGPSRRARTSSTAWQGALHALPGGPPRPGGRVPAAGHRPAPARRLGRRAEDLRRGGRLRPGTRARTSSRPWPRPLPRLFGGAADLSESNLTDVKDGDSFEADDPGRNLRFGVREHAMGGVANGIAYHGGFIPYAGTFLTFSDYMRGSVRLAALERAARDLRLDPRLRRASARTARPTSRSSTTPPSGRFRTCGSCGPATRTRPPPPGRSPSSGRRRPVRPDRAVADAAEAADARGHGRACPRGAPTRRLRPARGVGRDAPGSS